MSIYSQQQQSFTPLTAVSQLVPPNPPVRPESALTREQTLSFDGSVYPTPHLRDTSLPVAAQQQQIRSQHGSERNVCLPAQLPIVQRTIPIPEDTEIGTSARPLNELMKDINSHGEMVYVHRVSNI